MSIAIATKPTIPFISTPLRLQSGEIIRILGMIAAYGKRIAINLQHGNQTSSNDDVPLHIDFRPLEGNCVVRNSYKKNHSWGVEETDGGSPIEVGQFFELLIEIGTNRFRLAINGTHFCEFKYRMPLNAVRYIHIYRDADISTVSLERFGISLVRYPFVETVYNKFPLIMPLGRDGIQEGRQILIYGKPTFNADRISINLQNTHSMHPETDNNLIAFHISIRFPPNRDSAGIIVMNTFKGGWLNEERYTNFPFCRNQNYTIVIHVKREDFSIEINNNFNCNFKYRVPLHECKYLHICGDTTVRASV